MSSKLPKYNLIKALILIFATYLVYLSDYLLDYFCREFLRVKGICWMPNIFLIIFPIILFFLFGWFAVALINNVMVTLMEKSGRIARDKKRKKSEELFR